jgi:hypothetical protein
MADGEEVVVDTAAVAGDSPVSAAAASSLGSTAASVPADETDSPRASSPTALPEKRPSPWRAKKTPLAGLMRASASSPSSVSSPPAVLTQKKATTVVAVKAKAKSQRAHGHVDRKLFQDAVCIRIPLNVTADLGVAVRQTREKRMMALHQSFPLLKPVVLLSQQSPVTTKTAAEKAAAAEGKEQNNDNEDGVKGEATTDKEEEADAKKKKQIKRLKHVPQPHEYGSIVDYLEAKYVQGVMVDDEGGDENDDDDDDDDDEGQGSVYSQDSFFDDTDLQRTVAEQVLAHSTTTKLELQDDDQFFVNVGNLEVEETDLTQEQYDPLEDTNEKSPTKRKRKKPAAPSDKTKKANGTKKLKTSSSTTSTVTAAGSKPSAALSSPGKKAKVVAPKDENEKPNKKTSAAGTTADLEKLKLVSAKRKRRMEKYYKQLMAMIKTASNEELPRKKTKERVAITCPPDKKPGDQIMFANPHVPGQRLKVKIPKNASPGSTFKVTVPVADIAADDDTDYNKFSREFYDTLDDYARAYDNWCDAEQDFRKASGDKEFAGHLEKRKKFDELIAEFPTDLKTIVDKAYIQKILRRARQNKHKRERTMAKQAERANGESDSDDDSEDEEEEKEEVKPKPVAEKKLSPVKKPNAVVSIKSLTKAQPKVAATTTIVIPQLLKVFTTKVFDPDDF